MRYTCEWARRNCVSQVKLLGILLQGSRAVFFPQCIAERKKSLLWDIEVYKSSKKGYLEEKNIKGY